MKKALCLLVMLGLVASASATVRVFVTAGTSGFGLENNANHAVPTISNVYSIGSNTYDLNTFDYEDFDGNPGPLRPGTYPPSSTPSGTLASPIDIPAGDFAYIWLQFQNESLSSKINGLQVVIIPAGDTWDPNNPAPLPTGIEDTYYLCNNLSVTGNKRWDGNATPPNYPEWKNNQQVMVAITAYGIKNLTSATPEQLYSGSTRIALLGSIDMAQPDNNIYQVLIPTGKCNYASGFTPAVSGGYFRFLPEPASLLLLSLAGLILRRR